MEPGKVITAFKQELISIIESKYLFALNSEATRNSLANEANGIFNEYIQMINVPPSIRKIIFIDNTTAEEIYRGQMTLMVKAGDKILSVTEFFEKLETYLIKIDIK